MFKFSSNILTISLMLVLLAIVSLGKTLRTSPSVGQKYSDKKSFSFAPNITHQFIGSRIITRFAPKNYLRENINLQQLAAELGYDRFNWAIEFVTNLVGVKQHDFTTHRAEWEVLYTFRWQLANTHLNLSEASLLESDVAPNRLSPLLLKQMQLDGSINDY